MSKKRPFTSKPVGNRGVDECSGSGGEKQGRTWKRCGTFKKWVYFKKLRESRIIDQRQYMIINDHVMLELLCLLLILEP